MAPTFDHTHQFVKGYCELCGARESAIKPIEADKELDIILAAYMFNTLEPNHSNRQVLKAALLAWRDTEIK